MSGMEWDLFSHGFRYDSMTTPLDKLIDNDLSLCYGYD